jgi:hypothetical protein
MNSNEPIILTRDVEGTIVPVGTIVTLRKSELPTSLSRLVAAMPLSLMETCSDWR